MPKSKVRKIAAMGGKAHAKGLHDDDEEEDDESYRKGTPIPLLIIKKNRKNQKKIKINIQTFLGFFPIFLNF